MNPIINTQLRYWLPVYVWAALIFYFSSTVLASSYGAGSIASVTISDYYKHVIVYGFLTFLLWRALYSSNVLHAVIFAVIISVIYGFGNEVNQYFIPGRRFSFYDAFFNFIGSVLVHPLIKLYNTRKNYFKKFIP